MSTPVLIPLDRLVLDEEYQPRASGLSAAHLQLLRESDPQAWGPLLVAPNGDGSFMVLDGSHRTTVAREMGLSSLPCIVQEGAGYPEAVFANISHGLPLSHEDRKDAARWWAEEEPDLSYREIGRRVGLSDKTVKRAIETEGEVQPPRMTPDPCERWLRQTYRLDRPPSKRDVAREIAAFDEVDRAEVATFYAAVGQALLEAATPYLKGR